MDTDKISCVTINMHGNDKLLSFKSDAKVDSLKLTADEISELNKKNVSNLLLYGCNSGHLDNKNNNPAADFAKKINGGRVLASDGTVYLDFSGFLGSGAATYEARNDEEFRGKLHKGSRDNKGWVMYQNGKTRILNSNEKTLTLSQMLDEVKKMK